MRRVVLTQKSKRNIKNQLKLVLAELVKELESRIKHETRPRRLWTRNPVSRRDEIGSPTSLVNEVEQGDVQEHECFMKLLTGQFEPLLNGIQHKIQKQDTSCRDAIPAKIKLQACLYLLVTGATYRRTSQIFRLGAATVSKFIPEVLDAIYEFLQPYIKEPSTEEWGSIENEFYTRWNLPGCYGSIGGKHFAIQSPPCRGSTEINFKGFRSLALLAIVDHDYCFRYIDVVGSGTNSDGGIFGVSQIHNTLENGLLPNGGVVIGDEAFPLQTYLLRPFSENNLSPEQQIFNDRLSSVLRIAENAFGVLTNRFAIFRKPITTHIRVTNKIIRTACALHNWLTLTNAAAYIPAGSLDSERPDTGVTISGSWRQDSQTRSVSKQYEENGTSQEASEKRDCFASYLSNEGAVTWKEEVNIT